MSDTAHEIGLSLWQPDLRRDGTVEITVNFYHPQTGRKTFGSLTLGEYLAVWKENRLSFQRDGTPKPDHLPTPKQVEIFLSQKRHICSQTACSEKERILTEELRQAVCNTVHLRAGSERADAEGNMPSEAAQTEVEDAVDTPQSYEKRRRKPQEKLAALKKAACDLREEKRKKLSFEGRKEVPDDEIQLTLLELLDRAAADLRMGMQGLRSFIDRSVPVETKKHWLYGAGRRKRTRREIKFQILLQVRETLRQKEGLPPRKKELAEAATGPLGMTLNSARTYVYDRLTSEQVAALDLRKDPLTRDEQLVILKHVRRWMKEKKHPIPRITDLARIAAPYLGQEFSSVRTLLTKLGEETHRELELLNSSTRAFAEVDPAVVREGFVGAIAVLKLRRLKTTPKNLQLVIRIPLAAIEAYLSENPDIAIHLDSTDET